MIKRKKYFCFLIILIVATWSQIELVKANAKSNDYFICVKPIDSTKIKKAYYQWLTPKQFTPLSFIKVVTIQSANKSNINVTTMMNEFPEDWVKSSDLDSLVTLIGSTTKCNCFLNPLSSHIPTNENADVGGYAIIFINSFRQKKKINLGLYNCPKTNKESVDEIIKWWTDFKPTK